MARRNDGGASCHFGSGCLTTAERRSTICRIARRTVFMRPLSPSEAFTKLRRFCLGLGWDAPLVANRTPEELHDRGKHSLMRYFYTMYETDSPICLQINPQTDLHPRLFAISIFALRYRICTGWHGFMLDRNMKREIVDVSRWAHASLFETVGSRKAFRESNPECCDYTWKRIRDFGGPYPQSSTYERWQNRGIVD